MDQPGYEMAYLAAILDAFAQYEDLENRRADARNRNKTRTS